MAIGLGGNPEAVAWLEPLLADRDPCLRPLVIQALRRLGGARARELLDGVLRDPQSSAVELAFAREAAQGG